MSVLDWPLFSPIVNQLLEKRVAVGLPLRRCHLGYQPPARNTTELLLWLAAEDSTANHSLSSPDSCIYADAVGRRLIDNFLDQVTTRTS